MKSLRAKLTGALVAVMLMAFVFSSFMPAARAQDTSLIRRYRILTCSLGFHLNRLFGIL